MSLFLVQFNVWQEEYDGPYTRHIVLESDTIDDLSKKIEIIVEYNMDALGEEWELVENIEIRGIDDLLKNNTLSFFDRKIKSNLL